MITFTADATLSDAQELLDSVVTGLAAAIVHSAIPEWREVTAYPTLVDDIITGLTLVGPSDGKPFTVVGTTGDAGNLDIAIATVLEGDPGLNKQQRITLPGTATGGTFTLTFDGETTGNINWNDNAAAVDAALEALANIAAGDVTTTGDAGGPWTVEFIQNFLNTDVALMTGDGTAITKGAGDYAVVVTTLTAGDPGTNEKQRIWLPGSPTGGTFSLSWQGATTVAIPFNETAANVQTALEGLAAIAAGDVLVTGAAGGPWTVEFLVTYRNTDVDLISGDGANLTGGLSVEITETTTGAPVTDDIQRVGHMVGYFNIIVTNPLTGQVATVLMGNGWLAENFQNTLTYNIPWLNDTNFIVWPRDAEQDGLSGAVHYIRFIGEFGGMDVAQLNSNTPPGYTGSCIHYTDQEGGQAAVDEVQQVWLDGGATGGTFTLTFRGDTTGNIAYDATAGDVETALEAIASVSGVEVVGDAGGPWSITFGSSEAGEDLPLLTGSAAGLTGGSVSIATISTATEATNEVQKVELFGSPAGGTFTLTYDGDTTGALTFDESEADVEAALEGLAGIDDVSVTGSDGGPWIVTFAGTLTGANAEALTGSGAALSGADVLVEVMQAATDPVNEIQTATPTGTPTGGTFTLTFDGNATGAIVFDATAEAVRLALEATASISIGTITVDGDAGGPWTVSFIGTLGGTNVDAMTSDPSNLTATGTQSVTVSPSVTPTGPNWWKEANNWHNPAAPGTASAPAPGDTLWYQDSDVDCLYGIDENSGDTLAALHVMASYTGNIGLDSFGEYWEYRELNLKCGFTNVYIGEGEGSGSGRIRLDLEDVASTVEVFKTSISPDNTPAFVYKGGAATTELRVFRGSVGVAKGLPSDTANCQTLTVGYVTSQPSDAEVTIGTGCAAITTINKSGGMLLVEDVSLTTIVHDGGEMIIEGAAAVSTLHNNEGTVYYRSSGAITALLVGQGGEVDFRQSHVARTVTTLTMHSGGRVLDSFATVTFTNPIILERCSLPEVTLDVGTHRTLAIAAGA